MTEGTANSVRATTRHQKLPFGDSLNYIARGSATLGSEGDPVLTSFQVVVVDCNVNGNRDTMSSPFHHWLEPKPCVGDSPLTVLIIRTLNPNLDPSTKRDGLCVRCFVYAWLRISSASASSSKTFLSLTWMNQTCWVFFMKCVYEASTNLSRLSSWSKWKG